MEIILTAIQRLRDAAYELWAPGLAVLAVTLWIHRKSARELISRMQPESLRVNITAFVVDALFIAVPLGLLVGAVAGYFRAWALVDGKIWSALPAAAVAVLTVVIGDFVGYWRHRLEHHNTLWSSHVMHHSDTAISWLTIYRFHPINRLTTAVIDASALMLLGLPAWAIAVNNLTRHYYGIFVHMNLPWTFGPLGKLFVSPAMHRWHHVKEGAGVGCNFASIFSVFDRAFGTLHVPGPCNVALGVAGINHLSYSSQLVLPLKALIRGLRSVRQHRAAVALLSHYERRMAARVRR